jgi:hypothetical protein
MTQPKIRPIANITAVMAMMLPLSAQVDLWDLPPLRYSDTPATDAVAKLETRWRASEKPLDAKTELERVACVLKELGIPHSSQVLVFSKTSKQNHLIHPGNPRALYFSPDCYAGFVPGGDMEIIIQDPLLGPVFYLIDLGNSQAAPRAERDTSDCLSCHANGRTEHVPGVMVRSVFADQAAHAQLSLGTTDVDHTTPIAQRWGGYYVTGSVALPHLGNRTYAEDSDTAPVVSNRDDLSQVIDTKKYLQSTSDIVALCVLEHQCKAHNLLNAASVNYKRAAYLAKSLDPAANPDEGAAGRIAENAAKQIVDWFLFRHEAALGDDGLSGADAFQDDFFPTIPKAKNGDSLLDFQLNNRIFKFRCSYMIYSAAFQSLPAAVKRHTLEKIKTILTASEPIENYEYLKASERQHILTILKDTGVLH